MKMNFCHVRKRPVQCLVRLRTSTACYTRLITPFLALTVSRVLVEVVAVHSPLCCHRT